MPPASSLPIRVLIVDDSAFVRHTFSKRLQEYAPDIQIIGTAWNGPDALQQIPFLAPDVITLDINMPQMNGLMTLQAIMAQAPRPVIMVSTLTQEGAQETLDALSLGAVDFVPKPITPTQLTQVIQELADKIRAAAHIRVPSIPILPPPIRQHALAHPLRAYEKIVVIGASTGGPRALNAILPALPQDLPAAIVVVQHMPSPFTRSLAERLDSISTLSVKEATDEMYLQAGQVLVAPGGQHLEFTASGKVHLHQGPTVNGVRPAVDVTLTSIATHFGKRTIGVIVTGMGRDGTQSAQLVRKAGGMIIAEDASTSVVWGMPRSVIEAQATNYITPLPQIAAIITYLVKGRKNGS
ncbi:MAG: chemotaxis response regulator protein-glutamate methylesterase [Anaerolineales bacterium]|nr:chemotaxis response regulator protein-glutamate methylesterase [Anaerolineales bacterium]